MSLSLARSPQRAEPVLFERQRRLLTLLDALGGRAGNLDFQKLVFLHCQEPDAAGAYEFVPYKFGAFSFTSYADRRKLVERGLLADEEHHWQLTSECKRVVGGTQDLLLSAFAGIVTFVARPSSPRRTAARASASATSICPSWESLRSSAGAWRRRRTTTRCSWNTSARACRSRGKRSQRSEDGSGPGTAWR